MEWKPKGERGFAESWEGIKCTRSWNIEIHLQAPHSSRRRWTVWGFFCLFFLLFLDLITVEMNIHNDLFTTKLAYQCRPGSEGMFCSRRKWKNTEEKCSGCRSLRCFNTQQEFERRDCLESWGGRFKTITCSHTACWILDWRWGLKSLSASHSNSFLANLIAVENDIQTHIFIFLPSLNLHINMTLICLKKPPVFKVELSDTLAHYCPCMSFNLIWPTDLTLKSAKFSMIYCRDESPR